MLDAANHPLERVLGREMGRAVSMMHVRNGVDLRLGASIKGLVYDGKRLSGAALTDDSIVECDLILVAIGAVPNTDWLVSSGIDMASDGGLLCDANMSTSLPGVYAAGDIAVFPDSDSDRPSRMEHWSNA